MSNEQRDSRRVFLKRAAKTATYAAPVIHTLVAPQRAAAQLSGKMNMMNMGMMGNMGMGNMFMGNMGMGLMGPAQLMSSEPGGFLAPPWAPGAGMME